MTSLKLVLACAVLLAAISVAGRDLGTPAAQPFWELQGAAPGARETAQVSAWRDEARGTPLVVAAAR
jgi:hypothetical protein